jgi:erythromycin esterase-like protein
MKSPHASCDMAVSTHKIADAVHQAALPLTGHSQDYDPLISAIGDARFVLLGEASHGTHEFYQARSRITQRLIAEKDFTAVVVEADWPDAWRVNRFVRGFHDDGDAAAIENQRWL